MSALLKAEVASFTRREKFFILFCMICCKAIAAEYGITRPASNALFLTVFSSKAYPYVWLATVPLNLFVVYLYNRFLPRIGPLKMMLTLGTLTIAINTSCGFLLSSFPHLVFFHFAWKDIYILMMFKQLWSMIHSTIAATRAKIIYGIIFGMGTIGSVLSSLIPGFFAVRIGSEQLFFFTLPVYAVMISAYALAFKRSGVQETSFGRDLTKDIRPGEGFALIRRSPFLIAVLLLVVFMQVSVALAEYQFNAHLELNIMQKDLRTEYCGRLIGITNFLSAIFQFLGTFLMVHFLGIKRSHFFIPLLLCLTVLSSWAIPAFAAVSLCFVFIKSVDFSLFGIIREMLYIPLKLDEKFRAKAVIDVFAYRTSKALVSLAVIALQGMAGAYLLSWVSGLSIAVFAAWMAVVAFMFKKYQPAEFSKMVNQ